MSCLDFLLNPLSDFPARGCLMVEMHERSDVQLLRDSAEAANEAAFRELVTRYTVSEPDGACFTMTDRCTVPGKLAP